MDFAWFLYTILIMVIAVVACSTSMTVWTLTNRRDCLVAAAVFLLYALEVATILFDEYDKSKPMMLEYFNTGLTHPVVNPVLSVGIVACVWLWVALRVHVSVHPVRFLVLAAAYAVIAVLVAPVGERASVTTTMAFWGLRDLGIIAALLFAWWWHRFRAGETDRMSIERSRRLWLAALILEVLVLLEDIFFITVYSPEGVGETAREFFWHFTERNLSENVLMVVCAVSVVLYNRQIMQIFSQHPMEAADGGDASGSHRDFESRLLRFADDHGMSKREREVLALAINGRDTQGIASELFISTGTVKAHVHRIYTKAGVASRQELVNAFWKY